MANGDGFGIGFYDDESSVVGPCVYTSVKPAWNDTNLLNLSEHIRSRCLFAHVRAASPYTGISEMNCHPFKMGKFLFMHNGGIANFQEIKFGILQIIKDTTMHRIKGTTDTEHAMALFVHYLPGHNPDKPYDGYIMKKALLQTIAKLLELIAESVELEPTKLDFKIDKCTKQHEGLHVLPPSSLNFAVTNGDLVLATRFRNSKDEPPSLYYSCVEQLCTIRDSAQTVTLKWEQPETIEATTAVVIASEPLTEHSANWSLIPKNSILVITPGHRTVVEPLELVSTCRVESVALSTKTQSVPSLAEKLEALTTDELKRTWENFKQQTEYVHKRWIKSLEGSKS
eukprot:TRINITY_DN8193_c0_g1_i1.p1 TRINITY_DN8193_c0_g1~~TRINITY_DN8193_c0_g1_i1.p1  ORF type:complete len:395 (+),score=27.83 TRINITY_DN8193_c0_g1_i1:163-1185(+)